MSFNRGQLVHFIYCNLKGEVKPRLGLVLEHTPCGNVLMEMAGWAVMPGTTARYRQFNPRRMERIIVLNG